MNMKRIIVILLAVVMTLSLAACAGGNETVKNNETAEPTQSSAQETQTQTPDKSQAPIETANTSAQPAQTPNNSTSEPDGEQDDTQSESKILVAYFSATNNTEGVAQKLAEGLGADLYEITPETPYTDKDLEYGNSESRTSIEKNDPDTRPAISGSVENMEQYDVVFIGYPIWWGSAPRIMSTFIESYDFSGKTLVAFCTSASSGFGNSDSALRAAAGGAEWLTGHRFSAGASSDEIMEWAEELQIN